MSRRGKTGRRSRTKAQQAQMEKKGWRATPDAQLQARRMQRVRLKMKRFEPNDEADSLVQQFLAGGGKITKCPVGWALGAHRDGLDIIQNG